ncbi:DUF3667 domain-containing protein [Hymenobacter caeli]|uniref:DUF3667 domain-containing protein n=1 Tax=Hymenobacter caeli TaxID=2735894 RepID=A0ABX2FRS0_9BACT|nr:DUF3667 domain-containing protein [Hymenobacter caeli]NRT19179.1 hypothetical protein [Hymenobacter caeli]
MAHHATKQAACANCDYAFVPGEPDEFCPSCGQQNHAVEIGFGHVAEEFLEGIFHFDGKVFSTAKLLLFRPGELTRRFLAGHRVPYVPPIRLYVFISFVFFLLLGTQLGHEDAGEAEKRAEPAATKKLATTPDSDSISFFQGPKAQRTARKSVDQAITKAFAARVDSLAAAPATPGQQKALKAARREQARLVAAARAGGGFQIAFAEIKRLPAHPTDAQVDSVVRSKGAVPSLMSRLAVRRTIRWRDSTREEVVHQLLRGGSIMLFLLMPLAALLLKGAYFRQHRYYLGHLIFTVHVQCFLFIFLGLVMGLDKLNALPGWLSNLLLLVPAVYFIVALRTFYQQSWRKTVVKSLLLGVAYSLTALLSLLTVGAIGVALF